MGIFVASPVPSHSAAASLSAAEPDQGAGSPSFQRVDRIVAPAVPNSSDQLEFNIKRILVAGGILVFMVIAMIVSACLKIDKVTDTLINTSEIYFGGMIGVITGEVASKKS